MDFPTSSVFEGRRPSWLLFLTFLSLGHIMMVCSVDHGDKLRFFLFPTGPLVRNFAQEYRIFSKMTSLDSCWIAASAGNCFSFLWGVRQIQGQEAGLFSRPLTYPLDGELLPSDSTACGGRQSRGAWGAFQDPTAPFYPAPPFMQNRELLNIQYFVFSSSYPLLTHLIWWGDTVHSLKILGKARGVLTEDAVSSQTKALPVELDGTLQIVHSTEKQTQDPGREHQGWILECLCSSTSRAR